MDMPQYKVLYACQNGDGKTVFCMERVPSASATGTRMIDEQQQGQNIDVEIGVNSLHGNTDDESPSPSVAKAADTVDKSIDDGTYAEMLPIGGPKQEIDAPENVKDNSIEHCQNDIETMYKSVENNYDKISTADKSIDGGTYKYTEMSPINDLKEEIDASENVKDNSMENCQNEIEIMSGTAIKINDESSNAKGSIADKSVDDGSYAEMSRDSPFNCDLKEGTDASENMINNSIENCQNDNETMHKSRTVLTLTSENSDDKGSTIILTFKQREKTTIKSVETDTEQVEATQFKVNSNQSDELSCTPSEELDSDYTSKDQYSPNTEADADFENDIDSLSDIIMEDEMDALDECEEEYDLDGVNSDDENYDVAWDDYGFKDDGTAVTFEELEHETTSCVDIKVDESSDTGNPSEGEVEYNQGRKKRRGNQLSDKVGNGTNQITKKRRVLKKKSKFKATECKGDVDSHADDKDEDKEAKVKCPQCSLIFIPKLLNAHILQKHNSTQICHICGIVKAKASQIRNHIRYYHTELKDLQCRHCDYKTKHHSSLNKHLEHHRFQNGEVEKSFKCCVCDKTFVCQPNLKAHMVTHEDVMPYNCKICDRGFAQKNNWMIHMAKHRKTEVDVEAVTIQGQDTTHVNQATEANSQEFGNFKKKLRFPCEMCKKLFRWKHDMKRHMKNVHLGLKKFTCAICDKSFADRSALNLHHASTHQKQKDYACCFCHKKYYTKYKLASHISNAHAEQASEIKVIIT